MHHLTRFLMYRALIMLIPWRDLMRGFTRPLTERGLCLSWLAALALVLCGAAGAELAAPHSVGDPQPAPVLFIESNVPDYQQLAADAGPGLEVVLLDARQDGLRQMAEALADRHEVPAVHVISHGTSGALDLGTLRLDRPGLVQRSADLARIRSALRADADLLLYGCEVAQGSAGQEFMAQLARTLGANVAASSNVTGDAGGGGDWTLERQTGPVRSAGLAFPQYRHLLPNVAGTLAIPFNLPDISFVTPQLTDGQSATGTVDIPGIVYEVYFADTGNTQAGRITNAELLTGTGSMLIYFNNVNAQFGPVKSLIVRSQANRLFGLASFQIQDPSEWESTYTATAYRNNAPVGAPATFTTGNSTSPATVNLGAQFTNVDEVRITSDGGLAGVGANLWGEGFNTLVFVNPTGNADLSGFSASAGAFNVAFAANTTSYTLSVPNATASTTLTPTVDTPGATVTVNGVAVASGAASAPVALNVGSNTIATVVTALDGVTTKTYTVTVTRAAPPLSSNADLSNLALSAGFLGPAFASGTTSYTASVPFATTALTVTPTVADATATVTVNGVATPSGGAAGPIALAVGTNTITIVVTAQDGTTKNYVVNVTRLPPSSNADLSALSLSIGALQPAFVPGVTSYTAAVGHATTSVTVTPTVSHALASVVVNGMPVASGNASGAISLNVGANTVAAVVTAQDGSTKTYTITVTRSRPSVVTGTSPTGGGVVTASISGPAGCGFDRADFVLLTAGPGLFPSGGPAGYVFPQGLLDVAIGGCPAGAAVTITLVYPQAFPSSAVYMKYGPTLAQSVPHWYPFGGATVNGNTVTLLLIDGGPGDGDLVLNGVITDPGGAALALGGGAAIPTLGQGAAALLSLLLAAIGVRARRIARAGRGPA